MNAVTQPGYNMDGCNKIVTNCFRVYLGVIEFMDGPLTQGGLEAAITRELLSSCQ